MKKQSLVDRILAEIQGGDKAKLSRFESKLNKYFSNQIKMREDSIETIREKIEDNKEEIQTMVLAVDIERINSSEGGTAYCPDYVRKIDYQFSLIEDLEQQERDLLEEIDRLNKIKSVIYGEE